VEEVGATRADGVRADDVQGRGHDGRARRGIQVHWGEVGRLGREGGDRARAGIREDGVSWRCMASSRSR
jgi:hypothetical protein